MTREAALQYVIDSIRDFLEGTGGDLDWDDFTSYPSPYPELEEVRRFCVALRADYPPDDKRHYCNAEGLEALRRKLSVMTAMSRSSHLGQKKR